MAEHSEIPSPFKIPGLPSLSPDTTIGEIAQKIGRKLSLEQDTMVHQFAEKHPEVIIDDLVICHGQFQGENASSHYRIWVEVRTEEEKAQRDLHRHYPLIEPELLKAARDIVDYMRVPVPHIPETMKANSGLLKALLEKLESVINQVPTSPQFRGYGQTARDQLELKESLGNLSESEVVRLKGMRERNER